MPLDIQLNPYTLDSVLVRDSYLTHYQATGVGRAQYVATEFYPTYMADRLPNGTLKISDRFTKEFAAELDLFRQRAGSMGEVGGAILPIEGLLENNNTAYVLRRACSFTTVENYMNGQKMQFDEAFHFIRPLILSLAQAQSDGVVFNFSMKDLRVTPQRQLMLDATFSWEMNFHPCIIEIAKLYFKLITGANYSKDNPTPESYGVTIPSRLTDILSDALSGNDILYGSIDDFYKKVKFVLDLEAGQTSAAGSTVSGRMMGLSARVLAVLVILALGGLVYGGVLAYRANSRWASPEWFADTAITRPALDFTATTLTHPRNAGDTLIGSFHFHDIFLFYRSDWGRPVLARRRIEERALQLPGVVATEEEIIFVDNVRPSFISTWVNEDNDGFIYFANGLSENRIYRATLEGTERDLTRISENTALNLVVIGDYLFYSNYNRNHYLYRIELNTMDERIALAMPVFATTTSEERLFFLSGEPGGPMGVFSLSPENPVAVRHLAVNAGHLLYYCEVLEALFFNTAEGHVRSIGPEGELMQTWDNIHVDTFAVDTNWLVFTEPGRLQPRAVHMRLGDQITLDTSLWLSYIWARNGVLYGIDHIYNKMTHMIQLP